MTYLDKQKAAAQRVFDVLTLPVPKCPEDCGVEGFFDPWDIFPMFYGSYSDDFDKMAIETLENIRDGEYVTEPLANQMFREVLCTMDLCDYGTSPRTCFPSHEFSKVLPMLIDRWKAYSDVWWNE